MKIYSVVVSGRVQNVGYRSWALGIVNSIGGIGGWVKNLSNGNVELLLVGSEEALNQMVHYCSNGPARARVDNIVVNEIKSSAYKDVEKEGFKII